MRPCCNPSSPEYRRFSPLGLLFKVFVIYFVLVFGGGTLVNTGQPVAVEAGKLMQTVTLIHPAIRWAESRGYDGVARGLKAIAGGAPIHGRATDASAAS